SRLAKTFTAVLGRVALRGNQLLPLALSLVRSVGGRDLEVAVSILQERRPVRAGGVSAAVLPEGHLAVDQGGLLRGEPGGPQILLAQEPVHRTGADASQE